MKPDIAPRTRPLGRIVRSAHALKITVLLPLTAVLGVGACETYDKTRDALRGDTPRERYEASLEAAGLAETALARDWAEAGRLALANPVPVALPFVEEASITHEYPRAMAYRVSLGRGRKLTVEVSVDSPRPGGDRARLFVELFRIPADSSDALRPVANTDSMPWSFEYEPWRGGEFVLRVQPELLRGGYYTVRLSHDAQFTFPVVGRTTAAILSGFGAPRDGGRRQHHGVDIFSERGTPVVAASAGQAYRVGETPIGGKVVWVSDSVRQARVYYAHLDSQTVRNGQWVEAGDTIGFVGNTGNARTTPPHLHFGLYRRGRGPDRGPVDPTPFLETPPGELPAPTADTKLLGGWVRITADGVNLRDAPSRTRQALGRTRQAPGQTRHAPSRTVVGSLPLHSRARVLAVAGDTYRVELMDGRTGYVETSVVEPQPTARRGDLAQTDSEATEH